MSNKNLKDKTRLIVSRLESFYGIPKRSGQGKPLNSLVKTILSQNTNDRNRDLAYDALRKAFPDWKQVMEADEPYIAAAIRPAGLANQKSKTIKSVLQWIHAEYGTLELDFLQQMDVEEAIKLFTKQRGIGIKTISVVLMFECGKDIFPVDTHVHRVCQRLGLVPNNADAVKTHHLMQPLVPGGKSFSLHMNFLKLGRSICLARKPKCPECPLRDICPTAAKQRCLTF